MSTTKFNQDLIFDTEDANFHALTLLEGDIKPVLGIL